jgi:hypothetical protein
MTSQVCRAAGCGSGVARQLLQLRNTQRQADAAATTWASSCSCSSRSSCCCCHQQTPTARTTRRTQAALDACAYAEAMRQSLMGLFDGEALEDGLDNVAATAGHTASTAAGDVARLLDASAGAAGGAAAGQPGALADLDTELESLSGHEVIHSIMDQVCCSCVCGAV